MKPLDWQDRAACIGKSLLFFAQPGQNYEAARDVCRSCPVLSECMADALARESGADPRDHAGMRAGLSPVELVAIKTGRRVVDRALGVGIRVKAEPKPIAHGTYAGYQQHRRRSEPLCAPCRAAAAAYRQANRASRAS